MNASKTGNAYSTWQDLLDEEEGLEAEQAAPAENIATPIDATLPPSLLELMAERDRLKQRLDVLTGQTEANGEDQRTKMMYPVVVHTKETRIEERRLRRRDEYQHMLKQRSLEEKAMAAQAAQRAAERQDAQKRQLVEAKRQQEQQAIQAQERQANQRRKAIEKQALASRLVERQEQAQREFAQRQRIEAAIAKRQDVAAQCLAQARSEQRRQAASAFHRHAVEQAKQPARPKEKDFNRPEKQRWVESIQQRKRQSVQAGQVDAAHCKKASPMPHPSIPRRSEATRQNIPRQERQRITQVDQKKQAELTRHRKERERQRTNLVRQQEQAELARNEAARQQQQKQACQERIQALMAARRQQARAEERALQERLDRQRNRRDAERFS